MAQSINMVVLLGNVGKDPEIKTFASNSKYATFSLATSRKWKDKITDEWQEKTQWHNVKCWGLLADVIESYVKKGSKIYLQGEISYNKYESESGTKYYTEINANKVVLLDKKEEGYVKQESTKLSGLNTVTDTDFYDESQEVNPFLENEDLPF